MDLAALSSPPFLLATAAASAAGVWAFLQRRAAVRAAGERDIAERRAANERERAERLERDLRASLERDEPLVRSERAVLDGLPHAFREIAHQSTREDVAEALGRAIERLLGPRQWMVFLAADDETEEFVLAAVSPAPDARPRVDGTNAAPLPSAPSAARVWPVGARLTPTTGRIGLAVRRRAVLDSRDFDAEPPIVREQVAQTEPREFRCDCVVPVLVGGRVVAVLSAGLPDFPLAVTRAGLVLLAEQASAVLRGLSARESARRHANQDALTGLGNKSWFNAAAAEALYRLRLEGGKGTILAFGVDAFPEYARSAGNAAGDRLLRGIAAVIRPLVRDGEMLARWHGTEFVAFLPGTDALLAATLAERVRVAVGVVDWPHGHVVPAGRITLSAGVVAFPEDGSALEELVERALRGMQDARLAGGDRVERVRVAPASAEPGSGDDGTKDPADGREDGVPAAHVASA